MSVVTRLLRWLRELWPKGGVQGDDAPGWQEPVYDDDPPAAE